MITCVFLAGFFEGVLSNSGKFSNPGMTIDLSYSSGRFLYYNSASRTLTARTSGAALELNEHDFCLDFRDAVSITPPWSLAYSVFGAGLSSAVFLQDLERAIQWTPSGFPNKETEALFTQFQFVLESLVQSCTVEELLSPFRLGLRQAGNTFINVSVDAALDRVDAKFIWNKLHGGQGIQ